MDIIKAARKFNFGALRNIRNNDFFLDRICHIYTLRILLVFILLSTVKRFYTSPINCWIPKELKRYEKFMHQYCWIKGTHYAEQHYEDHTLSIETKNETLLQYYQWIHFFLIFQAFLFYLPRMVWCFVSQKVLDYDLFNMVDAAIKYDTYAFDQNKVLKFIGASIIGNTENSYPVERFKLAGQIQDKVEEFKKLQEIKGAKKNLNVDFDLSSWKSFRLKMSKSLLTFSYIMNRFLYLSIAVLQVVLMNIFLSDEKHQFYGAQVLNNIFTGKADLADNADSKIFPRISICDVRTREISTDHTYTVQCVLSFNLFNERIYAFLWFWIAIVIVPFLSIDLLSWIFKIFIRGTSFRYKFIKNRIKIYNRIKDKKEKYFIKLFTEHYVGTDGVFILRLIEHNSNAAVVAELINKMWMQFKVEQKL